MKIFLFMTFIASCVNSIPPEDNVHSKQSTSAYLNLEKFKIEGSPEILKMDLKTIKTIDEISPSKVLAGKPITMNFREFHHDAKTPQKLNINVDYKIDTLRWRSESEKRAEVFPVLVKESAPQPADGPRFKDRSQGNIQYLHVEEGLPSSYVWTTFMDSRSNLWIGTEGAGIIKYNGETFTGYDNRSGLSNNSVREILQTHDGDIWFGTHGGGLVRYDGTYFYHYTTEHGLSSNYVWSLEQDIDGTLFIGTEKGLNKLVGGSIQKFHIEGYARDLNVRDLYLDADENLWISTNSDGFFQLRDLSFIHYSLSTDAAAYTTYKIYQDNRKNMWIGTEWNGVLIISDSAVHQYTTDHGLHNNHIRDIEQDSEGSIWLASYGGGVIKYDGHSFTNYSEEQGLSSNYSRHLLMDSFNNIWVGTDGGGLSKISPNAIVNYSKVDGLVSEYSRGISQDSLGNYWISNYGGLNYLSKNEVNIYTKNQGLITEDLISTYIDDRGTLWMGTFNNGLICFDGQYFSYYDQDDGLSGKSIRYITKDSSGRLWFASDDNGVTFYDHGAFYQITPENGLPGSVVWNIFEDNHKNIWMATDKGLVSFNGDTIRIYNKQNNLPSNLIRSIYQDSNGLLWVGTYDNGVFILDNKEFYHINDKNGLPNNMISDIIGDDNGYVWIANEKGINAIKLIEKKDTSADFDLKWFQKDDGLRSLDFYFNSGFKDKEGNLWFGGGKSLVKIEPTKIINSSVEQKPQLESISIMGKFIDFKSIFRDSISISNNDLRKNIQFENIQAYNNYPENLELNHPINTISFQFYVSQWYSGKQTTYQYFLEGLDVGWSQETTENSISFNLTAGHYRLFVRAKDLNGNFSEPFMYEFTIHPPIWLSWWMISIYILSGFLLIFQAIHIRTRNIQNAKNQLERVVEERTLELSNRNEELEILNKEKDDLMNIVAHDLRSPLHKINGFLQLTEIDGELNDNQQEYMAYAKEVVGESVDMIQNLLDVYSTKHNSISIIEIDIKVFMREWIKGFQQQIDKKSQQFHFSMDPNINTIFSDISCIKRILDNLMSNAIKYSEKGQSIYVVVESENGHINFSIKDEGPGFSEADQAKLFKKFEKLSAKPTAGENSTGLGLSIVESLVKNLGGQIIVNTKLGFGTEFVVSLPKNLPDVNSQI